MTGRTPLDAPRRRLLRRTLRWLPLAGMTPLLSSLQACSLDPAPRIDYHALRDLGGIDTKASASPARIDKVLLLSASAAPTFYDTDRMVFSADGKSRSYFQYGFWTAAPTRRLLTLAEQRLAQAGAFRTVALSTSGVRGDLLLNLRLDELYLDDAANPAQARLSFTADLVDWRQRSLLARRTFSRSQAAPTRDASGLAQAASQATTALLDALVAWAVTSATTPA
jgi:cholesterol transport system auxiliary component